MVRLFKDTVAYRIVSGDKKKNSLSHAYLLLCQDGAAIPEYLKTIAKTIICEDESGFCDQCRSCSLIERNLYTDVSFYPKGDGGKILVADVDEMVAQTFVKPFEGDKRVFVFCGAENMTPQAQNKLLKTLEEPPKGVYVILGATNENAILPTVKSRVKKISVPDYSESEILDFLIRRHPDKDREELKRAASFADGKPGLALAYAENGASDVEGLVYSMLENMLNSKDVIDYSVKIDKTNIKEFLISLKKTLDRVIRYQSGGDEKSGAIRRISRIYSTAACLAIINKVNACERALYFNGNVTMLADNILLCVLEEKYRWKKL